MGTRGVKVTLPVPFQQGWQTCVVYSGILSGLGARVEWSRMWFTHSTRDSDYTAGNTGPARHTLPDSLIYKRALWDTHTETHIKISATRSEPVYTSIPHSLSSFPFLPSGLSCHSQTLSCTHVCSFCSRSQWRQETPAVCADCDIICEVTDKYQHSQHPTDLIKNIFKLGVHY